MPSVKGGSFGPIPILRLTNISKSFPGTVALSGVGLEIYRGEIHALVGQNGSGKSTLVKILAGYHQPDPGSAIEVNGHDLTSIGQRSLHLAGMRFVHQDLGLVGPLNSVENLALGYEYSIGRLNRIRWKEQGRRTREAIATIGHMFDVTRPVNSLSASERTALAIARALQGLDGDASLLVLDEPTAAMPLPEVERLFDVVRRVRNLGVSVLYVSHHLEEVFRLADNVTVLRDGRVVACRRVEEVTRDGIIEMMTGSSYAGLGHGNKVRRLPSRPTMVVEGLRGQLVSGVDLTLHKGEVIGLGGITGSGREDICDLIFGGRGRSGSVVIDGQKIPPLRPDLAILAGIGLVPADRHAIGLVLPMSIRENLTLPELSEFWKHLIFRQRLEKRVAADWIRVLGIRAGSTETSVSALSGGNQQKVVLSRWLRIRPRVLLLDSPTQGVDVSAKAEIHGLIDEAADQGMSILLASSDEQELARLCSRVLVMGYGRISYELTGEDVVAGRIVQESIRVDGTKRPN